MDNKKTKNFKTETYKYKDWIIKKSIYNEENNENSSICEIFKNMLKLEKKEFEFITLNLEDAKNYINTQLRTI